MQPAHYVARARSGLYPFVDDALARTVWGRLRRHFPRALAVCLMPNHLHLVGPDEGRAGAIRLGRILGATGRRVGGPMRRRALWQPVPDPDPLTSPDKLRRNLRYVWLNPCRPWRCRGRWVQLVDDPLRWPWSTLRDVVDAQIEPWTTAERVAAAVGWRGGDPARELHRYATRDEHVSVAARVFPELPPPSELPDRRFEEVLDAALSATRRPPPALCRRTPARRIAVGVAYRQGWRFPARLGPRLGLRGTSVSRLAARVDARAVEAGARCLDPRLLTWRANAIIDAVQVR